VGVWSRCCEGTTGEAAVIEAEVGAPLVVNIDGVRAPDTPDNASALLVGHGPALCVFFLAAAVPQVLRSFEGCMGTPFSCGAGEGIVVVEDVEEFEDMDEDEFAR